MRKGKGKGKRVWGGVGWGLDIVYVSGGRKGMWDTWKEGKEENCEGGREGGRDSWY